jgi:hypothetical protein
MINAASFKDIFIELFFVLSQHKACYLCQRARPGWAADLIIHNFGTGGLTISSVIANAAGISVVSLDGR